MTTGRLRPRSTRSTSPDLWSDWSVHVRNYRVEPSALSPIPGGVLGGSGRDPGTRDMRALQRRFGDTPTRWLAERYGRGVAKNIAVLGGSLPFCRVSVMSGRLDDPSIELRRALPHSGAGPAYRAQSLPLRILPLTLRGSGSTNSMSFGVLNAANRSSSTPTGRLCPVAPS